MIFYLRLLQWFTLRQLANHPWRVLTVLFGIALGAAVFTSVRLAVDASLDSFSASMELMSSKAQWAVERPGGRVSEDLVPVLKNRPDVAVASPLITTYVNVSGGDPKPFLLIGLDPILDAPLRTWRIQAGPEDALRMWLDLIRTPRSMVASGPLARRYGLAAGKDVVLEHVQQVQSFTLIGVLEPRGLALVESGYAAVADIATVQEFIGAHGMVDRIDLILEADSTPGTVQQLRKFLPAGVVLRSPAETKETGKDMIHAYQLNLSVLSFVSLFVGMFLVYSMISINTASRRGEIAILRSLGASSRVVFATVLAEGFIMGVLGWLLAIPIGSVMVRYLVEGVSSTISNLFVRVRVEGLRLDVWEVLLSFGVTVAVCVMAAYRPARESTRVSPREAMVMHDAPTEVARTRWRWSGLGLVLIGLTWPVSQLPPLPGFPLAGYASVLFLVVGFSLLSPPLLHWMGSALPPVLRRLGGEPAFLAARYFRDAGKRTSISVGALVTAVALFVSLVIMVHSFRQTVNLWVTETLAGDLFIRPAMADLNQHRDTLPEEVVRELRKLPGSIELLPYRRLELVRDNVGYHLEAVDFEVLLRHARFFMTEGEMDRIAPHLVAGKGVLVSEVFRNKTGLGAGERFQTQVGDVRVDLPILGVFRGYRTRGGVVHMDFDQFQRLTGQEQWSGVRFFFKDRDQDLDAAATRLKEHIVDCCGLHHPLQMAVGGPLRAQVLEIFDETFAVTTVLLLIALLVAGLGITATLTVLVLERIRQLNTLLAVGASERQLRTMVFWEALLMVTAGEVIGLICGFIMSWLLIYVINLQSFGWTFLYRVDWMVLLISLPLILATALLAALPAVKMVLASSPALVLKES